MDPLFSTFQTGLYKKNILSHNSPSERIITVQESDHLFGFLDTDDAFLTRVEMPIHFSGDLFRLLLSLWFPLLVSSAELYNDVCESSLHILSAPPTAGK